MATDLDGLHERLEEQFKGHEDEIEHIVASCDTCTNESAAWCSRQSLKTKGVNCHDFVPKDFNDDCVFINGEWWS